jgi:kynurenine formamidase
MPDVNSPATDRPPRPHPSETEVRGWLDSLSNWGRWGAREQLGTLNLLTPERVERAAATIAEGVLVSCALPIRYDRVPDDTAPTAATDAAPLPQPAHYMLRTGEGLSPDPEVRRGTADVFLIPAHGLGITHIDAPCHTLLRDTMYNGHAASLVQAELGALAGSVELVAGGIAGRAVLLDVARLLGRDSLADGEAVFPEDLEACETAQGVRVGEGDMLLVRTGYRLRRPRGPATLAGGYPGLQAACLPWLHERGVALLATDTAADVRPHEYALGMPIHTIGMWAMGLWLIDNCQFERLSSACAARGRWDPFLTIGPLPLTAGTGSPVNPLAIF